MDTHIKEAINDCTKAIDLYGINQSEEKVNALCNRALMYLKEKMYDEALNDFNLSIRLTSNKDTIQKIYYNMGLAFIKQEKYKKSIECFTKVIDLTQHINIKIKSYNFIAKSYNELEMYEKSLEFSDKSIKLCNKNKKNKI